MPFFSTQINCLFDINAILLKLYFSIFRKKSTRDITKKSNNAMATMAMIAVGNIAATTNKGMAKLPPH